MSEFKADTEILGRNATTRAERRRCLDAHLAGAWINADVASLERDERGPVHGWRMTKRT